jgi:hypothetical protein
VGHHLVQALHRRGGGQRIGLLVGVLGARGQQQCHSGAHDLVQLAFIGGEGV